DGVGLAAPVLRARPFEMASAHWTRLADRPCRWLFRVHAHVLSRLAPAVRSRGDPHGHGNAAGSLAGSYAGSVLRFSGRIVRRKRSLVSGCLWRSLHPAQWAGADTTAL